MAQKDNILQELRELQSMLANAVVKNTYQVPAGYFEGLSDQVFRRIRALEAANASDELRHLSSLLSNISVKTTYQVPAGYFEGLADQVLRRIRAMEISDAAGELDQLSPFLSKASKEIPYSVPAGYFDNLSTTALAAIKNETPSAAEELEELSPLLSGLKKEMPFSVPQGYFEGLRKATDAETEKPRAKVVSMTTHRRWFRYAAAAVVVSFVTMTGLLVFNKKKGIDPNVQSFAWVEKNLKKVSDDAIEEFTAIASDGTLAAVDTKNDIKEANEVKELLKDVPAEDLQKFLDDTESLSVDENTEDL